MEKTYVKRIAEGGVIVFAFTFIGAFLGYALRLLLTRTLTPADYGLFFAILAFTGLLSLFKDLGLNTAIVKYIPEFFYKKEFGKLKSAITVNFYIQAAITLAIFIPVIILAPSIANIYFKIPQASLPLQIIALSAIAGSLLTISRSTLQGFGKMLPFSILEPIRVIITITVILALINLGIVGVAWAYTASAIITTFLGASFVLKVFPFFKTKSKHKKQVTKLLLKFGIPALLTSVGFMILNYTDTIMLTYFRNVSEVGLYQVAMPTSQWLYYFVSSLAIVIFPVISEIWAKKEKDLLANSIRIMMKLSFIFIIPVSLLFITFPEIVLRLLFTNSYVHAARALQALSIGAIFYTIGLITMTTINGIGKPKVNTKIISIVAVFNIIINLLLIPTYGATGAAIATAISYFILMLGTTYYIRTKLKFHLDLTSLSKIVISGVVSISVIFVIKSIISANAWIEAIISIGIGIMIYFILIAKIHLISQEDMNIIKGTGLPIPEKIIKFFVKK